MQAFCLVEGICVLSSIELLTLVSLQVMSENTDNCVLVLTECMLGTELQWIGLRRQCECSGGQEALYLHHVR